MFSIVEFFIAPKVCSFLFNFFFDPRVEIGNFGKYIRKSGTASGQIEKVNVEWILYVLTNDMCIHRSEK